jgi:hypothetical protein
MNSPFLKQLFVSLAVTSGSIALFMVVVVALVFMIRTVEEASVISLLGCRVAESRGIGAVGLNIFETSWAPWALMIGWLPSLYLIVRRLAMQLSIAPQNFQLLASVCWIVLAFLMGRLAWKSIYEYPYRNLCITFEESCR